MTEKQKKINLKEGEIYDLAIKVFRRSVKIISQTETSIKVCCDYRTEGKERWKPIYCWISKKSILDYTFKEVKK